VTLYAFRFHPPPLNPCMRISRTRLTDDVSRSSLHSFGCLPPRHPQHVTLWIWSYCVETEPLLLLGYHEELPLKLSDFFVGLSPAGVVGSALADHALALTSS